MNAMIINFSFYAGLTVKFVCLLASVDHNYLFVCYFYF